MYKKLKILASVIIILNMLMGCNIMPVVAGGYYPTPVPYIQHLQKPSTIGYTDPVQRKKDFDSCRIPDKKEFISVECLKKHGYIELTDEECGTKKRPTGRCN